MNWKLVAPLMALLFASNVALAAGPCGCGDKLDIENRMTEINAAIAQYQNEIKVIEAQEKTKKQRIMYTEDRYKNIMQPTVLRAINAVSNGNAHRFTAETMPGTCKIYVQDGATACLANSLLLHEQYHQEVCQLHAPAAVLKPFDFSNYKDKMRLADVAKEEVVAYGRELEFLTVALDEVNRNCSAPGGAMLNAVMSVLPGGVLPAVPMGREFTARSGPSATSTPADAVGLLKGIFGR